MADEFNQNSAEVQSAVNAALNEQKKKKKKKRLIIFGVIALVIIVIAIASSGGSDDSKPADTKSTTSISAQKQEEKEADGTIGNYVCTIKSAKLCKDYEGKDAVRITYSFTNNASEAESFDIALQDDVYQDGIGLEMAFTTDDSDDWGIDVKIKPGNTKEVSKVYVLRNTTDQLEIEISELISFSDDKLTYNVDLK